MKAVIPVAGMGSNLRPHTHTQPKALVPVAGKPILGHIIDSLLDAKIHDFVLIIGYLGDKIEKYVTQQYPDINVSYVIQEPRLGLGHAISLTATFFKQDEQMLILLGDTIIYADLQAFINSETTVLGVKKVDNPRLFGVAEMDGNGFIKKLIEKPTIPKSNFALVGIYKVLHSQQLLEELNHLITNGLKTQNEFQLTDALMQLISKGEKMTTLQVNNWYDCGKKESLLEANAILLNRLGYNNTRYPEFDNNIIIPPVSIGKNCHLQHSIIGPNVAIGDDTKIENSIVENSIIGSFSELQQVVLKQSIIGNDTTLQGLSQSLNIGDNTEINFSR
ncbi:MAG: NTP transferase domain-containing protein [Verrucomicrobia bacterium]|nr:NTP transferase domain-containing protein [Cytophagales bacterium]